MRGGNDELILNHCRLNAEFDVRSNAHAYARAITVSIASRCDPRTILRPNDANATVTSPITFMCQ